MRTWTYRPGTVEQSWHLIDAENLVLGRLATKIATILRGKHRPQYSPNADCGDFVVIINADKIRVTGAKEEAKMYHRHSGYAGGLHSSTLREMREKHPERIIQLAVKGMMPKTPLGRSMLKKLKVYAGTEHPHQAQQPTVLSLD